MKFKYLLHPFIIVSSAILLTQPAFANPQFTYTSQELPFEGGYLGGQPDDSIGIDEPPYPSFSVSFAATENDSLASLLSGDLTISLSPQSSKLLNALPVTDGQVAFDNDGNVTAWHFALALTETSPATPDEPPGSTGWFVESTHGANTCNCDWFMYDFDIYTQRPYYTWAYANTVGFLYGGLNTNSPENWTIGRADVPEPPTSLLFLAGLAMIGLVRLRKQTML
jgi:hypothetical protein